MVLEGNVKAYFSFPGGFWKKMEGGWRGGMAKAHPQACVWRDEDARVCA